MDRIFGSSALKILFLFFQQPPSKSVYYEETSITHWYLEYRKYEVRNGDHLKIRHSISHILAYDKQLSNFNKNKKKR